MIHRPSISLPQFSNSNGVSFGTNGGTVTASVAPGGGGIALSAGTTLATSGTVIFSNANGVSFGLDGQTVTATVQTNYLTTAALSNHSHGNPQLNLTNLSGTTASNSDGFTLSLSAGNYLTTARASNDAVGLNTALTANGVVWTVNSAGISLNVPAFLTTAQSPGAYLTTAALSNHSHGNPTLALTNISGTTASASDGFTLSLAAAAPGGGATFTGAWQPFPMFDGSATMSGSLSQLNLQPFTLDRNQSFDQIQMIAIGAVPAASISNQVSARLTNSTQRHTFGRSYSIGNTGFVDAFLFTRGSGSFSTEIETLASTRNSFITNYNFTFAGGASLTNTAGGSLSASQTISMTVSYPYMTSGQTINGATSHTTFGTGYTTWTSSISNSTTFTYSTSAARTLSLGTTYPATVGWSGAKLVTMNFNTSLSQGEYWLGMVRHSSSSGSSSTANAFTGAAGTGNSFTTTYNSAALATTGQLTYVGKSATISASLGSLGFITTNNMAPEFGHGSFSGTWASNVTYLNNAGNPAGAVAFTQIRSNVSFFQSWFQMNSGRMV